MRKYTVQFYIYKNVHWPMFENLYHFLKEKEEVEKIIFCIPDLTQLVIGNGHSLMDYLLSTGETIVNNPREVAVDFTFIADTLAGKVKDCGKIVNIGHGTISKGYYFTESVWTERENWVDLLCVPGKYAKDKFDQILKTKVVPTGMPKLDPVFSGKYTKESLCSKYGLDINKKIVLYAPTFNIDLSSVFDFAERFQELHSNDYYIICKFHGSTPPPTIEQYKMISEKYPNIIYADEPNLAPFLGGADLMISDVSSAFMEFMALDKPVILYNNPNRENYHGYNPENIEYKWRDLGTEINNFEQLKQILPRLLNGDNKSEIRKKYASELFADLEGNSSANVWNAAKSTYENKKTVKIPVISVVLKADKLNYFAIREKIHNIQFYSVMPIELILVIEENSKEVKKLVEVTKEFNQFYNFKVIKNDNNQDSFLLGKNSSIGEFVLFMESNVTVFKNFDYMIFQTMKSNPNVEIITGVANLDNYSAQQIIPYSDEVKIARYAYEFIWKYRGKEIQEKKLRSFPPLFVIRNNIILQQSTYKKSIKKLLSGKIHLALSLYYNVISEQDFETIKNFISNYYNLSVNERLQMASKILQQYFYADLAELVWRDLLRAGGDTQDILKMMLNSCYTRYYDIDYKDEILKYLKNVPEIYQQFAKEVKFLKILKNGKKEEILVDNKLNSSNKKFLFYFFKNVHIPILLPIYKKLKEMKPNAEIAFSYLKPALEIRAGLTNEELKLIEIYNEPIYEIPQQFQPDITFIADSVYPWVKNCGKLVHVGHGILSKGQYYTDTELARREEQADLVCVPGSYHAEIMKKIISKPVVAAGMAKLDKIFSGKMTRNKVCEHYGIPKDKKYILFAPTFNDELSAIPFIGKRINEIIPDNETFLLIKLHGSTKKEYRKMFEALVQKDPRVILAGKDETDLTPFLVLADLMISDVSSAMIEFAALDKPVILFNNPNWEKYKNFNPNDIEYKFRDLGIEVNSIEEIKRAVKIYQRGKNIKSKERVKNTSQLLENNGNAAEKIILETLKRF